MTVEVVSCDPVEHLVDGAGDRFGRVAEVGVDAGRPLRGLIDAGDGVADGVGRRSRRRDVCRRRRASAGRARSARTGGAGSAADGGTAGEGS
jgi:hypothetical protein